MLVSEPPMGAPMHPLRLFPFAVKDTLLSSSPTSGGFVAPCHEVRGYLVMENTPPRALIGKAVRLSPIGHGQALGGMLVFHHGMVT